MLRVKLCVHVNDNCNPMFMWTISSEQELQPDIHVDDFKWTRIATRYSCGRFQVNKNCNPMFLWTISWTRIATLRSCGRFREQELQPYIPVDGVKWTKIVRGQQSMPLTRALRLLRNWPKKVLYKGLNVTAIKQMYI